MKNNYLVATIKKWNIQEYKKQIPTLAGSWSLITDPKQLTLNYLRDLKPKYIFFPHWSWIVPEEILREFTCVCFHMTDLPYGRGGSPLQNLISRGHAETKLSALKMTKQLDAGDIYLKASLSLQGNAQQIFERSAILIFEMINSIVRLQPMPVKQVGEAVIFSRRTPEQSEIKGKESIKKLYDHIRMMDADTYPTAFLKKEELTLYFDRAEFSGSSLTARVTFKKNTENNKDD